MTGEEFKSAEIAFLVCLLLGGIAGFAYAKSRGPDVVIERVIHVQVVRAR